jgi:superfamily I DNA and/or RNA helicase
MSNELENFKWFLNNLKYERIKKRLEAKCEQIGHIINIKSRDLNAKRLYVVKKGKSYDRQRKVELEILHRVENNLLILEDTGELDIYYDDGERVEKLTFRIEYEQSELNGISFFRISKEDNDNDNAENDGLDPFFDENATVYINDPAKDVRILEKSIKEERILALKTADIKQKDTPDKVYLKYNTVVIQRQLEAIEKLIGNPQPHHEPILQIMKEEGCLSNFEPVPESFISWKILKDNNRLGVEKQREFIRKALATEDFALMEGPPGSGKTTCITELILQILERGATNRICLTASTHVAVDNVLERLEEYNLPILRVGGADRRSDIAEKYSIEKVAETEKDKLIRGLKEKKSKAAAKFFAYLQTKEGEEEFKDFIYKTTNVVCSTTNSISNYKEIWENKYKSISTPPIFDWLILDEASKTTIPEFLLPAVYSKRFIIIGDRKQLSPYVDQQDLVDIINQIRHYEIIRHLGLDPKEKKRNDLFFRVVDDALLIKVNIDEGKLLKSQARLVLVPEELRSDDKLDDKLKDLRQYLKEIFAGDSHILYSDMTEFLSAGDLKENPQALAETALADIVIVFENDVSALMPFLPIRSEKSPNFKLLELWRRQNKSYSECSAEQAWRYNREYELRNLTHEKQDTGAQARRNEYKKEADALTLADSKGRVQKNIDNAVRICNGSILECLQTGYNPNYKGPATESIPIRTGLKDDLPCRFTTLNYQYRMDPKIAEFPREMFYDGEALKDDPIFSRSSAYFENKKPLIWRHVHSEDKCENCNKDEVKEIERLVRELLKDNPKPEDNGSFTVAIITFYRKQEKELSKMLQAAFGTKAKTRYFKQGNISLRLCTVDRFQGNEADMVIISLVRSVGVGFLDSPNRLNVALTRARRQLIIVGDHGYFSKPGNKRLHILRELAKSIKPTYSLDGKK